MAIRLAKLSTLRRLFGVDYRTSVVFELLCGLQTDSFRLAWLKTSWLTGVAIDRLSVVLLSWARFTRLC